MVFAFLASFLRANKKTRANLFNFSINCLAIVSFLEVFSGRFLSHVSLQLPQSHCGIGKKFN